MAVRPSGTSGANRPAPPPPPKKEEKKGPRPGCFATLIGRIAKLEFKVSGKGNTYAEMELKTNNGQTTLRTKCFHAESISRLEQYQENEFIAIWGAIDSSVSTDGTKVYTNMGIMKVIPDDEAPQENSITAKGIVMQTHPTQYGVIVDLDMTEVAPNGKTYDKFVRVQLSKDLETGFNAAPGDFIGIRCEYTGKFGTLTGLETIDPNFSGDPAKANLDKIAPPPARFRREVAEPAAAETAATSEDAPENTEEQPAEDSY